MRREIKLIVLVFVLVVGPAVALSFLSARVLESWQIVLQKRMAGAASRVLDESVVAWEHELASLHVGPGSLDLPSRSTNVWVMYSAGLSLLHSWVGGLFVYQADSGLIYPGKESPGSSRDSDGADIELEAALNLGGAALEKGDTNSAIRCFERVSGLSREQGAVGSRQKAAEDVRQRDSDEGFFYDLIALRRLVEIFNAQGQRTRAAEIEALVFERVLERYDELVPLQRDSIVEWLGGRACSSALVALWRERMRGRAVGQETRAALESGFGMMEKTIPSAGWATIRLQQSQFLVTKILHPGIEKAPFVLALQFDESALMSHLDALFTLAASNTEIRVHCRRGETGEMTGAILASRQLPPPFDAILLVATPEDVPAFMANARLQARLYRGGGLLLLISVVAGVWLMWREAAGEIRQAKERSDFAAAVSHDLRTPLSSMRMLAESLFMGNVPDEAKQKKFLSAIIKESDRLSRLTDRALYFIRYGQGALRYQFTEGDLGGVVREAVDTFAVGAGNGVKIAVTISPGLSPVRFDAGAIEQVVYNLLDNAVKYSPKEATVQIEVGLMEEAGKIALWVQDHGVGMTSREARQVLKPYRRGQNAGRQNARGIGLGLALCQHVVQAHGGRIQIQSEPGKGSKFSILLPG